MYQLVNIFCLPACDHLFRIDSAQVPAFSYNEMLIGEKTGTYILT